MTPKKKLVDRFEVVGVRLGGELHGHPSEACYEGEVDGTTVRILRLNYPTHTDARLGAVGLRMAGYTVLGIMDLHTDKMVDSSPKMVDSSPLHRGDLGWQPTP